MVSTKKIVTKFHIWSEATLGRLIMGVYLQSVILFCSMGVYDCICVCACESVCFQATSDLLAD